MTLKTRCGLLFCVMWLAALHDVGGLWTTSGGDFYEYIMLKLIL